MIKVILFDLSDVLIKGLEGSEQKLAEKLQKPTELVFDKLFSYNFHDFWLGNINEEQLFSQIIKQNNWNIAYIDFITIIKNNFYEIPGTRKLIKKLRRRYKIIMLSTISPEWVENLRERFDFEDLFDAVHYSFEIGFTKRQKEAFEFILNTYHLKVDEVILIDDSTRNINTARMVGIQGIKFLNAKQVEIEIKDKNIL